jgi:poly-gamma-glutamate synthesis protein (capsule biosynthesis protein)
LSRRKNAPHIFWQPALCAVLIVSLGACQSPSLPFPVPTVTLALLGDVMLGRGIRPSRDTFAYLQPDLQSADLALANLESPLTTCAQQTHSQYALCAAPEKAIYLAEAGFDLLALANNHHLDCGQDGLEETQRTLVNAGMGYIGPGAEAVLRQVNGLTLAFLAFDATTDFDLEDAAGLVLDAQNNGAIVVVTIHWGSEYQSGATNEQKRIASRLVESGAALIWGHHPHVLQPVDRINTSVVLYSLGNALFDQGGIASTRRSALVMVTLDSTGVRNFHTIPFIIDVPGSRLTQPDSESNTAIMEYFK